MTYTATFSNPLYNAGGAGTGRPGVSESVSISSFSISKELNRADLCDIFVYYDVSTKYFLEDSDTNPIQLNSTVEIMKGSERIFYGFVIGKPTTVQFEGLYIRISCADPIYMLSSTVCPASSTGPWQWTLATDTGTITNVPMLLFDPVDTGTIKYYGSFSQNTLWPNPADAQGAKCYVSGNTATCVAFNNVADQIELQGSGAAFPPRGWVKVDSEWIYYPTVWYDVALNKWYLGETGVLPCYRGRLGTVAVGHLTGATVTSMLPKYLAPGNNVLEYDDGGGAGYVLAPYQSEYLPVPKTGCYVYSGEIHKTGTANLRDFRATFKVYDDDLSIVGTGGTRVTVNDCIRKILQGDPSNPAPTREAGGAGILTSDLDLDTYFDNVYITRFSLTGQEKQPQTAKVLQSLFNSLSLITTGDTYGQDEIAFFYNYITKKYTTKYMPNITASSYTISGVSTIQKDLKIDDLYSGALVEYEEDQSNNILNAERSWHAACSGGLQKYTRAAGKTTDKWADVDDTSSTSAGNFGHDAMIWWTKDGEYALSETRCTQVWNGAPNDPNNVPHSYWWFTDTADAVLIETIRLVVGCWRLIGSWQTIQESDKKIHLRVVGCNTWNPTAHTPLFSSGGWEDVIVPQSIPWSENPYQREIKVNKSQILNPGPWNCIAILFEYMSGFKTPDTYVAPVYLFEATGSANGKSQVFVQLTDDSSQHDIHYLYYPEAYRKLRYGIGAVVGTGTDIPGIPKILRYKISGGCSEGAAISIGRLLLESHLIYFEQRDYNYSGPALTHVPILGEKLTVNEDNSTTYSGHVHRCVYTCGSDGISKLDLTLLNHGGSTIA